ncbi:MAG: ABC transporter ATP-binding protein [Prevotella sp.]|nr:ABC transporter ATP-binding protein [Prevotella sp.]
MSNLAIQFDHVGKLYRLGQVGTGSLVHDLNRWWVTKVRGKEDPYLKIGETNDRSKKGDSQYVWALRDITFDVEQGDVVGIIGRNGAGKSTLLKLLSSITSPTTGVIRARGRIGSLLEVGTGFHPEMTGRENIYMNGSIMGMTRQEITRKLDEIVDFAGVERYLDTPVKRYSSGMTVRLGFAVAAFMEPEILVVDEVLAVGDAEFQKKAIGKMQDVSQGGGRTVLFVSHNMGSVRRLCSRGILLDNGEVKYAGNIEETIGIYLQESIDNSDCVFIRDKEPNSVVYFKEIHVTDSNNKDTGKFQTSDDIYLYFKICFKEKIPHTNFFVTIQNKNNVRVTSYNLRLDNKEEVRLKVNKNFLVRGDYSLLAYLYLPGSNPYDKLVDICSFSVIDSNSPFSHLDRLDYGLVFPNIEELK